MRHRTLIQSKVKEIDTDVKGQKVLNFKGIGHGPANQNKAAVESNTRDVFKASHERQNEISEDAHKMDATAHSAQNKYADSSHSAAAAAGFPLKPQARCERLSEDRYRDTGDMIEKAAKQPAHPSRPDDEEHCVSRASGIYTSNQDSANEYGRAATQKVESAYRKGIDALDQGLQAMKDMASTAKATDEYTGPNSKEFPHTVPANNRQNHAAAMIRRVRGRPEGQHSGCIPAAGVPLSRHRAEVVAHRGERDLTSY
ncbi:hypothetical protein COCSUDRAFT_44105 [Coccomyxa subellipsoidea C-169]|uniref:Uncharacterized protein n=1 Tax=Coccomyxa subellipsoidea (strain C-169) TaxID=574566 RepID=I0YP24_COCSC|nr:hypothetical protein COCSUDRAFT_44105 [Coccomyxa subellipsoidea C-169]EIE20143.1 hypothetical protein COCSUDRAFT_44105 [Coccomyxa subellipsoidea C-169]|eukprot:XP_005644687.1 hypothetical protein COCSUDRAFT_44105 [Coccomyxa subellipsoidea C-169]